ncbi:MAG: hypothetical protein MJZ76_07180 [Bacteroidales bacterium]|nr:hypothetical protein [Bacteroidales bacterium]
MNFESKIEFIQSFIDRCDECIVSKNVDNAKKLQKEIISTFSSDISQITSQLDSYAAYHSLNKINGWNDPPVKYIDDLVLLKNRLIKLKLDLQEPIKENMQVPLISLTQVQNQTTNVNIDFEATISIIERLPESSLNVEDKEILLGKLASLKGCLDKNSKWEKCKGLLKWLADKSVDAAIAVLPYIIGVLKG